VIFQTEPATSATACRFATMISLFSPVIEGRFGKIERSTTPADAIARFGQATGI